MILLPWLTLALISAAMWLPPVPAGLAMVAVSLLLIVIGRNGSWLVVSISVLPVMALAFALHWRLSDRLAADLHGQDFVVDGWVCDFPRHSGRATRFLFVPDPASKPAELPARIRVTWYEPAAEVAAGSRWHLKLRLRQIRGLSNPGGFDAPRQALLSGVGARAYVRPSKLNRPGHNGSPVCPLIRWRAPVAVAVERSLQGSDVAGYLLALTVGARHRLESGDWDVLRRTGTAHLMAISGLHIGLLAGLGLWAGRCFARVLARISWVVKPAMAGPLLALIAAAGYAALAGFSIPTSRALVMVAVAAGASGLGRTVGAWRTLSAALFGVLLFEPLAPLSIGFWMSFAAVACLLSGSTAVVRRVPAALTRLLVTQFRIVLGLAPLAALLFGQFSMVSPLANLFAVPVVGLIVVPLALAGAITAWLDLADWPLQASAAILEMLLTWLSWLAGLSFAARDVLPRAGWAWLLAAVATVACLWPVPFPPRRVALWLFGPVLLGIPPVGVPARLRVTVADVGQGLAVVVQTRRHVLLYDTGPAYDNGDAGRSVVVPTLRYLGLTRLDRIVVSHSDTDHSGGLRSILRQYPGTRVMTSAAADLRLNDAWPCHAGQSWNWDGVQ
ncbi:MAG TPA: DNA internalization-related competence protein ComEC/Rec2, partial [Chromatiales bacterium]|nr:DNA internalization-related competence protein ComEC/Rec2 [Chromatiales bacterium]